MTIHSRVLGCCAASLCWLVAALPAQSGIESRPTAPARVRMASPPVAPTGEAARLRLAEVMAMLEEDQLTPEQRRRALVKLAEVQAQLGRIATPGAAAPPAVATPPRMVAGSRAVAPPAPPAPPTPLPAEARELRMLTMPEHGRVAIRGDGGEVYEVERSDEKSGAKVWRVVEVRGEPTTVVRKEWKAEQSGPAKVVEAERFLFREQEAATKLKELQRVREQLDESRHRALITREQSLRAARRMEQTPLATPESRDAEIQGIVEQMRAEIREIRALLQEVRGKLDADEPEAPAAVLPSRVRR